MISLMEETARLEPLIVEPDDSVVESDDLGFADSWRDETTDLLSPPLSWVARETCGVIETLEDGYVVRRPIPYEIEQIGRSQYIASFDEANIAIGGMDPDDAYQALIIEILNTFDTLTSEEGNLAVPAATQLEILRAYIERPQQATDARR